MDLITTIATETNYSAFLVLGCGLVLIKNDETYSKMTSANFTKIRKICGVYVGFSLFGYEV